MKFSSEYKYKININSICEKAINKEVLVWGACQKSNKLISYLSSFNINIVGIIDNDLNKIDKEFCGYNVFSKEILNQKKYFIIIPINFNKDIYDFLLKIYYEEDEDFIFLEHSPIIITNTGKYHDCYNNSVSGLINNANIIFHGYNSHIKIARNFKYGSNFQIELYDNATVSIAENTSIGNCCKIIADNNSVIEIGYNSRIYNDCFFYSCNKLTIANNFFCSNNVNISCQENTSLRIGENCMFSNNVNIRTNDGHSIFDLNTKQKISREKSINIGNHVWIGLNSTILHCDIEDGCIIGANSIVNRSYKPNCIIAGNPAKVIRENILWDKRNDIMFEDL